VTRNTRDRRTPPLLHGKRVPDSTVRILNPFRAITRLRPTDRLLPAGAKARSRSRRRAASAAGARHPVEFARVSGAGGCRATQPRPRRANCPGPADGMADDGQRPHPEVASPAPKKRNLASSSFITSSPMNPSAKKMRGRPAAGALRKHP